MKPSHEKLAFAFKRLIHVLTAGKKTAREYGGVSLYQAEVHIVEMIGDNPGISASDIASRIGVTKGAISQLITKLMAKELLDKRAAKDNLRVHELYLTPQGLRVHEQHARQEQALIEAISAALESCRDEEIIAFAAAVDKVSDFAAR